jgi:hypothetical protein
LDFANCSGARARTVRPEPSTIFAPLIVIRAALSSGSNLKALYVALGSAKRRRLGWPATTGSTTESVSLKSRPTS